MKITIPTNGGTLRANIGHFGNAAFSAEYGGRQCEIERIVSRIKERIEGGETSGGCVDICGNVVGAWTFKAGRA